MPIMEDIKKTLSLAVLAGFLNTTTPSFPQDVMAEDIDKEDKPRVELVKNSPTSSVKVDKVAQGTGAIPKSDVRFPTLKIRTKDKGGRDVMQRITLNPQNILKIAKKHPDLLDGLLNGKDKLLDTKLADGVSINDFIDKINDTNKKHRAGFRIGVFYDESEESKKRVVDLYNLVRRINVGLVITTGGHVDEVVPIYYTKGMRRTFGVPNESGGIDYSDIPVGMDEIMIAINDNNFEWSGEDPENPHQLFVFNFDDPDAEYKLKERMRLLLIMGVNMYSQDTYFKNREAIQKFAREQYEWGKRNSTGLEAKQDGHIVGSDNDGIEGGHDNKQHDEPDNIAVPI